MTTVSVAASSCNDVLRPLRPLCGEKITTKGTKGTKKMIRAVVFDLWETLITNSHEVTRSHADFRLRHMSRILETTPEEIRDAYHYIWTRCQELYWSNDRDIPTRTQIAHFLEALDRRVDEPTMRQLEDVYANAVVDLLPSIVPGADEVLAELSRRFALGLISNTGRTPGSALRIVLDRLNLSQHFDAMVFSNEHGECKPQLSIFESVRASLGVQFNEMVFVGDNPYVDVYGAQRSGMRGVLFVPPERGTAVAKDIDHGLTITPDATIADLHELLEITSRSDFAHAQTRRS